MLSLCSGRSVAFWAPFCPRFHCGWTHSDSQALDLSWAAPEHRDQVGPGFPGSGEGDCLQTEKGKSPRTNQDLKSPSDGHHEENNDRHGGEEAGDRGKAGAAHTWCPRWSPRPSREGRDPFWLTPLTLCFLQFYNKDPGT